MKHPAASDLALYSTGDLGWFRQRQVEKHVAVCDACRSEADAFTALSAELPGLNRMPAISWNLIEAEMKANIRLGLAAGECVSHGIRGVLWGPRGGGALASLALLAGAGFWMHGTASPEARGSAPPLSQTMVLESSGSGIQVRERGQVVRVLNARGNSVIHSVSARGEMRDSFVDAGYVTINNVHLQ